MYELLTYDVRFKFKEESSNVLNVGASSVSCWNLDSLESRLEIPGKFWSVVLEKDGKGQLGWSCEKWSIA